MRRSLLILLLCAWLTACAANPHSLGPQAAADVTPIPPVPVAGGVTFPQLLRRLSLAPEGGQVQDLLQDTDAGRLYVSDSHGRLHVLDAQTYDELALLDAGGELLLDTVRGRLYAYPRWPATGAVTVVDPASLSVTGTISPAGTLALDTQRDRLYIDGHALAATTVYDAVTLEKLGEIPHQGIPIYNPLRDEVYLVDDTVYRVDPETWQVTEDLFPEISAQPCPRCLGNRAVSQVYVYPERNLMLVAFYTRSRSSLPVTLRVFDATTREEISAPEVSGGSYGCDGRFVLVEPVDGLVYRGRHTRGYNNDDNLWVTDVAGNLEIWRDGLAPGLTNPRTAQMYVPRDSGVLVLDLPSLTPAGSLPSTCVHSVDAGSGRLYAFEGRDLLVFAERGGTYVPPRSTAGERWPAEPVNLVVASPGYATDRTLFVGTCDETYTGPCRIYRSRDGGETWTRLRGGLPESDSAMLALAISPDFVADGMLFTGGSSLSQNGYGVYRSLDGGDTWQPSWAGLEHLHVTDLVISPDYAADGTLWAYADYQWIGGERGRSLYRSQDRGVSWSPAMTATAGSGTSLSSPDALLPGDSQVRFRITGAQGVERSVDGGQTWHALTITGRPGVFIIAVLPSPDFASDRTVYVVTDQDVFRSGDAGDTWDRALSTPWERRDWSQRLSAATITPLLQSGQPLLCLGSAVGDLWVLSPDALAWEPVVMAERWPTVLDGEMVDALVAAPGGSVWLGMWAGGGLAHYAGGTIQARYGVTEGLPGANVSALTIAPDGALWAGTALPAGVARFDGQVWMSYPFAFGPDDPPVSEIYTLKIAPDGTLWAGGDVPGVLRWDGSAWERLSDPERRIGGRTYRIEIAADGALWCATEGGLAFYKDGTWSGGGSGEVFALDFRPDGSVYAVGWGGVVSRYSDGRWDALPPARSEGYFLPPYALHVAGDGAVWLGTSQGVFRYDGHVWRALTVQEGLPDNGVADIVADAGGRLWFATSGGAASVDPVTLGLTVVPPASTPETSLAPAPDAPLPEPSPAACEMQPDAFFAAVCADTAVAKRLGCAETPASVTWAAFQPFERAVMIWREDFHAIDVLGTNGYWGRYADSWDDSQPEASASLTPPRGLYLPERGFGSLWHFLDGQASLGWALEPERGYEMRTQQFVGGGVVFSGPQGEIYVMYADGGWQRFDVARTACALAVLSEAKNCGQNCWLLHAGRFVIRNS